MFSIKASLQAYSLPLRLMKITFIQLIAFVSIASANPFDQDRKDKTVEEIVRGKVISDTGEPLAGLNITVKGTSLGTVTDANGNYSIRVPDLTGTLIFSYTGKVAQEIAINGKSEINISMTPEQKDLGEVLVIGYGTAKKTTLTGSVTTVKGSEIIRSPTMNVSNSLAGRLSGVTAITRSGEPGNDGSIIRIRGTNTLGNNSALIVVDGVPGRSLDRIDPNSIESVTVLKDASAAIYGAQAANGVILITTKRGKAGRPQLTVNANQGFSQPTRLPKLTDAAEYATALNEVDVYRGRQERYTALSIQKFSDGSDPWGHPNTDWFEATYKDWTKQSLVNVNMSGGSEFIRYFVSLGTKGQDAYYKNSATKYNQYDMRSNLDVHVNKNINIAFDITGRLQDSRYPTRNSGSILSMLMRGKPTMPAYWPNGLPGPDIEFGDNPVVISTSQTGYDNEKLYVLNSNFKLNVKIPWIKGLTLTGNAALDNGFRFRKRFQTPWYLYAWDGRTLDGNGVPLLQKGKKGTEDANLTQEAENNQNILLNGLVNYEPVISKGHKVKFLLGSEFRKGKGDRFNAFRRYFVSTTLDQLDFGGVSERNNGGNAYQNARLNYFSRANYSYKEKYLVEFVWRYDGSYIFPEASRFGFFPGVSLGWRASEENFWQKNLAVINNFKLRASYGQTGNDRIDEWQYLSTYIYGTQNQNQVFDITRESSILFESRIPNPNVTWEVANQGNIGFDAGLLNDKVTLTFDYFDYRRSKMLWRRNASVPTTTGLTLPQENIGKVTNRGFDFDIAYRNQIGNIKYQIAINAGYTKNKITFWDEAPGAPDYQQSTGRPMPSNSGSPGNDLYYQAIGIFKDTASLKAFPGWPGARAGDIIFKDVNGDNIINANDRVRSDKGNMPTLQGGIGLNIQYKMLDVAVLGQGSSGAVRYFSLSGGDFGNYFKEDFDGRWTAANANADKPRISNRTDEYWRANRNTYFLRKTDFIRLKNIEIGYTLPQTINQKIGTQSLRVFISGFNLLTYTPDLKDLDPEDSSEGGINYPLQKIVNFGLAINL